MDVQHRQITNRLKLKLSKNDIDTGVHILLNKISLFNLLKEIIESGKTMLADILIEEMIDHSLRSQDDSGSSDHSELPEFDTEEKPDNANSNEIIES